MFRVLILALTIGLCADAAYAAQYNIDPDHSTVGFKIKHLAISTVSGVFTVFNGKVKFDPSAISSSSVEAVIQAGSINTQQAKRDEHLRSADFFDAVKFPEMRFVSRSVKEISTNSFDVTGDLTMHGITKPVTLAVTYQGDVKDPWGNQRAAFSATTQLRRKDYGIAYNAATETGTLLVGDEVSINLDIECVRPVPQS